MEPDEKFLDFVLTAIVDYPLEIKIQRTIDEMGVLLRVSCHKNDMGKIIGRQGETVKCIRSILRVVGARDGLRVNLKIDEPESTGQIRAREAFTPVLEKA